MTPFSFSVFIMIIFIASLLVLIGLIFKLIFKNPHPMYLRILKISTIITFMFNIIVVYYTHHVGAMLTCLVCVFIIQHIERIYVNIKYQIK